MNDLIEVMPFEYQIVESENGNFRVEGVFQRSDTENANKRVYPRSIWEKELEAPRVVEALQNKAMFGELDHPADGKTKLQRVSHVITNLELQEDGVMTGAAEILPTPNGKILKSLFESGVQVGISSRGSGSVQNGRVQEDFKLNTFDFVARPSTPGALPRPSGESKGGSRTEGVEDAEVTVVEDDPEIEALMSDLEALGIGDYEDDEFRTRDFNEIAEHVIDLHNATHSEDLERTPDLMEEVNSQVLELGHELTSLAAEHPAYRPVVTDLLSKVEESREAMLMWPTSENMTQEEPMKNRLEFIKDRLQEADEELIDEAEELRQELDQYSDDDLVEMALEAGVISPEDLEEDEYDDDEVEITPEDLLDHIDALEEDLAEATEVIQYLAELEENSDEVADLQLKYEAALGIIQETVGRYQLLAEAVGGDDKADRLMESHLAKLEAAEADEYDINEDADDVTAILNEDGDDGIDPTMARYKELTEGALDRTGLN
jgi:hypothetical protein